MTVVTGFLGAGKTTLVNRFLSEVPRGEIAVIVNEHGDVGIDGELLAARVSELIEITGGCVCCATQRDLVQALSSFAGTRAQRVLVETSGAASPSAVVRAIASGGEHGSYRLDGVLTVVDATRLDALPDLAIEQVGFADVVVLSRADRCDPPALEIAASRIASLNGAAIVVPAARGEMRETLTILLDARRSIAPALVQTRAPHTDAYESISFELDGDIDGDRFAEFMESELATFAGRLFRTKGILSLSGVAERMIVQGVADLVEVTFGEPWGDAPRRSRFVVVGYGLDREALTRAFEACAA